LANLKLEKEQLIGTVGSTDKAERKKARQEKKNRNLKYSLGAKRSKAEAEADKEEQEPEEFGQEQLNKKRRLAQYGIKSKK